MNNNRFNLEELDKEILEGKITWWQMTLPSGNVIFGEEKAKMLGYPESNFKTYKDFTDLLHKDDYDKTMQAMRDHLEGKKPFYEALYRIKHKNGEYVRFYDCGQILKKDGGEITVIGFVLKVKNDSEILEQMKKFKELILQGEPSMVELVREIRIE